MTGKDESGNLKTEVKNIFAKVLETPYVKTEDEERPGFVQSKCPYNKCDGSGTIQAVVNGYRKAMDCDCYKDEVLRRKLRNANLDESLWNKKLDLSNLEAVVLHPRKNPPERKLALTKTGKPRAHQEPENPEEHIYRVYQHIQLPNGYQQFIKNYIKIALGYLKENPVTKVKNLMLIGDTGRGKTLTAGLIGKEFLLNGRTVYFTTMRSLVNNVLDKEKNIEQTISTVDLLIIDKLGYEYHTDSGWAVSNIKEFLQIRYNKKLPVVATTNMYPSEIEELYDKSLMSLFHGTYFMLFVDNKKDGDYHYRLADESLSEFGLELPVEDAEGGEK